MTAGQIYRAADRRFTSWKNGGGETAEVLCHPAGTDFENFKWRISTARVASSGPFSVFPGIDRVLAVIEGGEMTLALAGGSPYDLGVGSPPVSFPGDVYCHAELRDIPLLDLNLMVRRPLRAQVLTQGDAPPAGKVLAAWLFALQPLADIGLERHDLLELDRNGHLQARDGTLLILVTE